MENLQNTVIQEMDKLQNTKNRQVTEYRKLDRKWINCRLQEIDNKLKNTGNGQVTEYRK